MEKGAYLVIWEGLFPFVGHDVEHLFIGFGHGIAADGGEVVDAFVDIIIYYPFVAGDHFVLHSEEGGEHR